MENQINNQSQNTVNKKTVVGIIILVIGAILLLNQAIFFQFSLWAISWPLVLIGYGLYTGFKHNFKKSMWIIYTMVGVIFLLPNIIPSLSIGMLWPLIMIGIGVTYIVRRDQKWKGDHWEKRDDNQYQQF